MVLVLSLSKTNLLKYHTKQIVGDTIFALVKIGFSRSVFIQMLHYLTIGALKYLLRLSLPLNKPSHQSISLGGLAFPALL